MRLSEIVRPDARIARSVNLERDLGDPESLDRYLLTGKGLEIVGRLTAGLNGEKVSAWSLTGPYGMGKSAFVRFLLSLSGDFRAETTETAREMLARKAPDLSERFLGVMKSRRLLNKGFFQVAATAAFEPINRTLADALARAARRAHEESLPGVQFRELNEKAAALRESAEPDPGRLAALFREAGRIARAPVAVVVDEFGKNLEYLARRPGRGDLFILQTLAESEGIFLWVCLHQAFEAYAAGLGRTQRQEWGKVQGRFEDVAFVEPRSQMRDFIGETLVRPGPSDSPDPSDPHGPAEPPAPSGPLDSADEHGEGAGSSSDRALAEWADHFRRAAETLSADGVPGLDLPGTASGPERAFPLHPLAAALLPELCTRFAQNDRTLFAFLCGGEPHALPAFLRAKSLDPNGGPAPTFGPERLYDYFLGAAPALALGRPGASRWLEIHEMVEGARNLPDPQRNLLKIIGLLNLVSGPPGRCCASPSPGREPRPTRPWNRPWRRFRKRAC